MLTHNCISKHIEKDYTKILQECNTNCIMCREKISSGIHKNIAIKKTFTDFEYFKYPYGKYICESCYKLIDSVIPSENKEGLYNSLRNYSYIGTEKELRILKREELEDVLFNIPEDRFIFAITYNNKKHTAFKVTVNNNRNKFIIRTDIDNVLVDMNIVNAIYPIMQNWYTEYQKNKTYFSKSDILNGCNNYKKIEEYGISKYIEENRIIDTHRNTNYLKLLVFMLNKDVLWI